MSVIDHACGAQPMVSLSQTENSEPAPVTGEGPLFFRGDPHAAIAYSRVPTNDGLVAVVFNGCIYNHRELRRELEARGSRFVTDHSDTEVLLHGWRAWGKGMFGRLDGMFACAIWDRRNGSLVLARDSFGEKPLYCVRENAQNAATTVVFSQALLPGLVSSADVWATVRPPRGSRHARGSSSDGIRPRHWTISESVTWACARCSQNPLSIGSGPTGAPGDAYVGLWGDVWSPRREPLSANDVDAALAAAVSGRLEADVPLGCFLSGGIDSALVCHYARSVRPDIKAFTVRMPHPDYDESEAASLTARHLGIRHEILDCDARPSEDLVQIITELGLPFGDSSLLPSMWVSRAARQHVKVALSGDGGDELFLGYDRYRALKVLGRLSRIPKGVLDGAASVVGSGSNPKSNRSRFARLLNAAAGDGYKELTAIFQHPLDRELGLGEGFNKHYGMTPMAMDSAPT